VRFALLVGFDNIQYRKEAQRDEFALLSQISSLDTVLWRWSPYRIVTEKHKWQK